MKSFFRVCLLFCVLILSAFVGQAKTITIPAQSIDSWQRTKAPLVYVFSDKTYLAVDYPTVGVNSIIFAGSPANLNAFKKVTCTLVGTTVTIPSFTIPSTIDGQDATDAHLSFYLYDSSSKAKIGPFGDYVNLMVPNTITSASACSPVGGCATLSDLKIYNAGSPSLPADTYYTRRDIDQKLLAVAGLPDPGGNGIITRTAFNVTGVITIGTANQVLGVNGGATANEYKSFAIGTSGTDFAIAHGAGTVTFNLPTASAANRGALSTADWSTFNGKQTGDAGLTALAAFNTNGFMVQTATDTFAGRTLQATANQVGITNPAGTAGDPTFSLAGPHNFTTLTLNGVLYGNTTSAIQATAQGAANSVLTANAGAPIFSSTPTVDRAIVNPSAFVFDLNANSLSTAFLIGTGPATPLTINVPTGKVMTGLQFNANNTGGGKLVGLDIQLSVSTAFGSQDIEPVRGMLLRVTNSAAGAAQKTSGVRIGSSATGTNASRLVGVDADITIVATTDATSSVYAATVFGAFNDRSMAYDIESNDNGRLLMGVGSFVNAVPINAAFYRAWMANATNPTDSSANARAFQLLTGTGANELAYISKVGFFQSGLAGTQIGGYGLSGNTSGTISILPQAAAGTYNFNLPITAGTAGQALTSGGGGSTAMTWSTPGWVEILTQPITSSTATVDFTAANSGLDDTYDAYVLVITNAVPVTDDAAAWIRIGTGAGPTFQTSGYEWSLGGFIANTASTDGSTSDTKISMSKTAATEMVGNASGENFSAHIRFDNPELTTDFMHVSYDSAYNRAVDGIMLRAAGGGDYRTVGAITGIRFMFSTGNILRCRATLYGLRKI